MHNKMFHGRRIRRTLGIAATAVALMLGAVPAHSLATPVGTDTTPPAIDLAFPQSLLEQPTQPGQPTQPQPVNPIPAPPRATPPDPQLDRCTIKGTRGNDRLTGTSKRDVICGLGGDDRIRSRGGNDLVIAGAGRDKVDAGAGRDVIQARDGSRDRINGGHGRDRATTDRADQTRKVEVVKRQAAHRSLRSGNELMSTSFAGCYDKRVRGLARSQFQILSGGMQISAHGGVGYGYEWARVQDFLFLWNGVRWEYQTTDTPAFARVALAGRISSWMLSNGTSVELNPSWSVVGGYWLATQLVTWYDSGGRKLDDHYYALPHTRSSDGAGGGDGWLTENTWCGVG